MNSQRFAIVPEDELEVLVEEAAANAARSITERLSEEVRDRTC